MPDTIVSLQNDQVALFGYGSLISKKSLEMTLDHPYAGPFVACALVGWYRTWDVAMPNELFFAETPPGRLYPDHILYLNVMRKPGSLLNGVLFVVNESELNAMDRREWIYSRQDVSEDVRSATVRGGRVHVYVGKPEHLMSDVKSPRRAAVRRSYLDILERGFGDLGQTFRTEYERSSDPPPTHLIIDDQRE